MIRQVFFILRICKHILKLSSAAMCIRRRKGEHYSNDPRLVFTNYVCVFENMLSNIENGLNFCIAYQRYPAY